MPPKTKAVRKTKRSVSMPKDYFAVGESFQPELNMITAARSLPTPIVGPDVAVVQPVPVMDYHQPYWDTRSMTMSQQTS